jgi:hypothetical protein
MEGTEELLADIRLLLDELGVEAGRTQSLTIERHEPISLVDRAQEAKSPFLKRKLLRYNRHDLEGMLRIRAALVSRV